MRETQRARIAALMLSAFSQGCGTDVEGDIATASMALAEEHPTTEETADSQEVRFAIPVPPSLRGGFTSVSVAVVGAGDGQVLEEFLVVPKPKLDRDRVWVTLPRSFDDVDVSLRVTVTSSSGQVVELERPIPKGFVTLIPNGALRSPEASRIRQMSASDVKLTLPEAGER